MSIELTPELLALVPIVAAILQLAKRIPFSDKVKEFFPIIGMVLAYGIGLASGLSVPILQAVVVGLMASGAYDAIKALPAK